MKPTQAPESPQDLTPEREATIKSDEGAKLDEPRLESRSAKSKVAKQEVGQDGKQIKSLISKGKKTEDKEKASVEELTTTDPKKKETETEFTRDVETTGKGGEEETKTETKPLEEPSAEETGGPAATETRDDGGSSPSGKDDNNLVLILSIGGGFLVFTGIAAWFCKRYGMYITMEEGGKALGNLRISLVF